jgi:hypothetical protein
MAFDKPSLKGRALRYLAAREYSRFELEQKLKAFEENEGELKAALDDLEAKGFISEARVVSIKKQANLARQGYSTHSRQKASMQAPSWTQQHNCAIPNSTAPWKCGRASLVNLIRRLASMRNKPDF